VTDTAWPDGFHVTMQYDSYGRPTQMLENGTQSLAKYAYDALNRRTQVDLGNGTRTEVTYDSQGGVANLNHRFTSSAEDWLASFTRNQLGEIRQTSVTTNQYAHDPQVWASTFRTNALNQYTGGWSNAFTYDLNGNLTGEGVWRYSYDLDNRLKTASRLVTDATLDYDPEGRLVRITYNGAATNLLYDGQNLAAEYDAAGTMKFRYVFGPGVDAPLVQYEGAGTNAKLFLYADHQGSIVSSANATGATMDSVKYGPFGETTGTQPYSNFLYTAQHYLARLQLYYYKARFYSPALGRFLQTDPIGTADDLNLYAYVKNNPVNFTDPTGMIAASGFGSPTNAPAAPVSAPAAPATTPKLNAPAIGMPATAAGSQAAIQVAAVVFGHGDRHVDDPASARLEILRDIPLSGLTPGAGFWGRTENYE
jgi:RHS repeat-associated protein